MQRPGKAVEPRFAIERPKVGERAVESTRPEIGKDARKVPGQAPTNLDAVGQRGSPSFSIQFNEHLPRYVQGDDIHAGFGQCHGLETGPAADFQDPASRREQLVKDSRRDLSQMDIQRVAEHDPIICGGSSVKQAFDLIIVGQGLRRTRQCDATDVRTEPSSDPLGAESEAVLRENLLMDSGPIVDDLRGSDKRGPSNPPLDRRRGGGP